MPWPRPSFRYASLPVRAAVALAAVGAAWILARTAPVVALEQRLYDLRLQFLAHRVHPAEDIVIVGIDDESLERLEPQWGRWPWPRHVLAAAIRYCDAAHTIVLDVLLPEADLQNPDGDRMLADAVRHHGGVVSAIFLRDEKQAPALSLALRRHALTEPEAVPPRLLDHNSALAAYPALRRQSAAVGFVNFLADGDGVLRGSAVVGRAGGRLFPSLALAAALRLQGDAAAWDLHAGALQLGPHRFPLDAYGRFLLWPSAEAYSTIPIADLLLSRDQEARGEEPVIPRGRFRNKIVLIGSLATGLEGDRLVTSLSAYVSGVSSVATALDNLRSGAVVHRPSPAWSAALALAAGLLPALPRWTRPRQMLGHFVVLTAIGSTALVAALYAAAVMVPVTIPTLALMLSFAAVGAGHWAEEYTERRRLEQLEAAKQQFTDMVIHDLHHQIAPVLLTLTMLRDRSSEGPPPARLLDGAVASTRRLAALTGALLDIRRLREGRMELHRETVRPGELFADVVSSYTSMADRPRLQMPPATAAEPRLSLDPDLVCRALANLVWNALRHAAPDTTVELGWTVDGNRRVRLWVANRGEPIPSAEQDRILQPFVTGSGFLRRELRGAGLGLAFCKLVAEAHGGTVHVESPWSEHGGARIDIRFPPAATAAD